MTDALSLKLSRPTALRGNPFHGLVKGGQLTLPNAATMPYPQPVGEHWQQGSTSLIKHPNAPGITRSPEQQAEDTAAGLEWWDRAILSSNQLYGKELQGWIYIDPNGDRWMVTSTLSTLHISGGTCSVTLARFGVLGGEPESYTYSVTVPNMGQATPAINLAKGNRLTRFHTSPTGAGAVFELSVEFQEAYWRWWSWRPAGWVEMTLEGPGAECVAEVSVLKTRMQALGSTSYTDADSVPDDYYLENLAAGGARLVREQPTSGNAWTRIIGHGSLIGVTEGQFSGYVVAMFYDEGGALHELTLSGVGATESNDPPYTHTGPTEFEVNEPFTGLWTSSRSTVSTLTLTYALDGVALHSYEFSVTETISESLEYRQGATGGTERFKAVDVLSVFTPGGTYSLSKAEVDPNASIGGGFWNPWFDFSMPGQPGQTPSRISQSPFWFDQNNVPGRLDINPVRHSNLVFGLLLWELPNNDQLANYRVIYDPVVVTPAGAVTLPAIEIDQGNKTYVFEHHAYASHCPVTGQTARDSEPVCYV